MSVVEHWCMRLHRHPHHEDEAVEAPSAAAWWDGTPVAAAVVVPVIHAARAGELARVDHPHAA